MPATNEARAKAIVAQLSAGTASAEDVFAAFEELDHMPADVVRTAFEPWTGPAPDLERLDDAVRRAHRLPLRTPRLRILSSMRDADILDLGEVAESQIRAAGKTWDGLDLDAFDRLDGERAESFAGSLERRVLGEVGDKPLYDAILFNHGAVVFRAGTTHVAAVVADQRVESTDRAARPALELALRDHIFAEHVEEDVPSTVSPVQAMPPVEDSHVIDVPPPPPSTDEPVPSTIHVQVPTRDPRQVELPFVETAAPAAKPSKTKAKKTAGAKKKTAAVVEEAPAAKKKKTAAATKAAPAPAKKKTATKKKAAAAPAPAPKKKKKAAAATKAAPVKKKTATKKKSAK